MAGIYADTRPPEIDRRFIEGTFSRRLGDGRVGQ